MDGGSVGANSSKRNLGTWSELEIKLYTWDAIFDYYKAAQAFFIDLFLPQKKKLYDMCFVLVLSFK